MQWHFDQALATQLTTPMLLIQGGDSAAHRLVARVAGILPRAEVATIDGDDHLLPQRSPDALGRLVAQFARRHR